MPKLTSLVLNLTTCLCLSAAAMSLAGCNSVNGGQQAAKPMDYLSLLTGNWDVSKIEGKDLSAIANTSSLNNKPSMSIDAAGKVFGSTGVNRYSSSFDPAQLASGKFSLSPAAATKMAGPPEASQIENAFTTALSKVSSIDLKSLAGGNLSLLGADGSEVLRFVRSAAGL